MKDYEYLSDEDLGFLIASIEDGDLAEAPGCLLDDILEAVGESPKETEKADGEDVIAERPEEIVRPPRFTAGSRKVMAESPTLADKRREVTGKKTADISNYKKAFFRYTLHVAIAAAAAIAVLALGPRLVKLGEQLAPEKESVMSANIPSKEEYLEQSDSRITNIMSRSRVISGMLDGDKEINLFGKITDKQID